MQIYKENDKKQFHPSYQPKSGSFAVALKGDDKNSFGNNTSWYTCREEFHYHTKDIDVMLFSHRANIGKDIAKFIYIIEHDILKHKKLTICGPTSSPKITWVKPANFWKKNNMRRSLFTALLRSGRNYRIKKNNFEDALYRHRYLRETKTAVEWFFQGNTWFGGNSEGWYNLFKNQKEKFVKEKLTKKPIKISDLFFFALDKLEMTQEQLEVEYRKAKHPNY